MRADVHPWAAVTRKLGALRQRTRLVNAVRGHAAEFGVIAAEGIAQVEPLPARIAEADVPRPARGGEHGTSGGAAAGRAGAGAAAAPALLPRLRSADADPLREPAH